MKLKSRLPGMTAAAALLITSGCSSGDERLVRVSERSAERQREQNQLIARQSEAVIAENQRIAEAARELVAKGAEARLEMVQAHRELRGELQAERSSIDRQRAEMERERREIAQQRGRDPIVAEAIHSIGALLVCLVPLLVAAYALSRLDRGRPEDEELSDLLVREVAGDQPKLLASASAPALGHEAGDALDRGPGRDPPSDDAPDPEDAPF